MLKNILSLCLIWLLVCVSAFNLNAAEFHVSPTGSPDGNGTRQAPWDLATALSAQKIVQGGDTIWLHAGTYRGGFTSRLAGRPDAPIVVRGEANKRITIDTRPRNDKDNGLLSLQGADVIYRDFEVTCGHPTRVTNIAGSWPADIHRGGVDVRGDRISLVNLVVHDLANGFGFWSEGEGGEISGCLIYNNGWRGPDRGHGHAIYAQNAKGVKRIVDNVMFHQFAYGVHVYGSPKASLEGFHIEGNIVFENGCLSGKGERAPGILVGGGAPAKRITVRDNVVVGGAMRMGYPWGTISEDIECTGNYCDQGFVLRDFRKATVMNNTFSAHSNVARLEAEDKLLLEGHRWNENDYYVTDGRWGEFSIAEGSKSRGLTFDQWRRETGFDSKSTFTKDALSKQRVIVRPNAHEAGRAHIAVLNPASEPTVKVDLSQVLSPGQRFRIVSAKDFYGPNIASGVYEGKPLEVSMKPITPPAPVGMPEAELPVTEPQFAAFVALPEKLP